VLEPPFTTLSIAVMAMLSVGGIVYVLLYPLLSGQRAGAKRLQALTAPATADRIGREKRDNAGRDRNKRVQETLKEVETRNAARKTKLSLRVLLQRAGLSLSPRLYLILSAVTGLVMAVVAWGWTGNPLIGLAAGVSGGAGMPRWFLGFRIKRRQKKFLQEFPNAMDVIVRGVKAGLPLNDCLRVIAAESAEPVKSEFKEVVDGIAMGMPTWEAVERVYERMPLAEMNFFAITISIQQRAGGNLAETLSNLSKVLRDRKKMRGKIQAMSQEAKASAAIIGALPIAVMALVYLTSPDYIALLFTEPLGHVMLAGSALWMLTGVLVMRKMINFDF
jgi:tight adherence protein B